MITIECKNKELIKNKIIETLCEEDKKDLEENINELDSIIETIMDWDQEILEKAFNKAGINFIIHSEFCEGGCGVRTKDFKFNLNRGADKSNYYSELAKMYTILGNKDDYDIYINTFC